MSEYQGKDNELKIDAFFRKVFFEKPEVIKFVNVIEKGPWNLGHYSLDSLMCSMRRVYQKIYYMGYKEYANGDIRLDFNCIDNEGIFDVVKIFTDNSEDYKGIRIEEHYKDIIVMTQLNYLGATVCEYAKPQINNNKKVFERHYPYKNCGLYKAWFGEFRY